MPYDEDHKRPSKKRSGRRLCEPRKIDGLVNARSLSLQYDTFNVPSDADIRKIKPGDFVKLARNGERFWVRVDGYIARKWHGTIDNKLTENEDIGYGDKIFFYKKNIYDVMYK